MLACHNSPQAICDPLSDEYKADPTASCGTDFSFPYFISFYVLCSFLVRTRDGLCRVRSTCPLAGTCRAP